MSLDLFAGLVDEGGLGPVHDAAQNAIRDEAMELLLRESDYGVWRRAAQLHATTALHFMTGPVVGPLRRAG